MLKKLRFFSILALFLLLLLAFSVFLSGCSLGSKDSKPETTEGKSDSALKNNEDKILPQPGYMAPDFELEDLEGNMVKLSDLRNKTVVVNFWSMGCKFCLQEMPDFDEFNKSKPEDVEVLMINLDTDARKVPTYIQNQGYSFTVLKDEEVTTLKPYLIRGVPTTIIVGKGGKITFRMEGILTKEHLETLIQEKPSDKPSLPS